MVWGSIVCWYYLRFCCAVAVHVVVPVVVVLGVGRAVVLLFGGGAFGGAGSSRVRYREGNGFVVRWRCMWWCR